MATITEASVKIAPMMLRMMVIDSVLSGGAESVDATRFALAGIAASYSRVVERDMIFCLRK